jgi:hypothetical protein
MSIFKQNKKSQEIIEIMQQKRRKSKIRIANSVKNWKIKICWYADSILEKIVL